MVNIEAIKKFQDLFGGRGTSAAASASCAPDGDGGSGSPTCAKKYCDRLPLGGSTLCGLCEAAQHEGRVVLVSGTLDRLATVAGQRSPAPTGIQARS